MKDERERKNIRNEEGKRKKGYKKRMKNTRKRINEKNGCKKILKDKREIKDLREGMDIREY